jgi:hypothetical protein
MLPQSKTCIDRLLANGSSPAGYEELEEVIVTFAGAGDARFG